MTCFVPAVMTAAPGRLTCHHIDRVSGLPLGRVIDAARLVAQGADVFISGADVEGATRLPSVPDLHPIVAPLVMVAGIYAFIEQLARRRGFDPDTPPHLRKVTETV